MTSMSQLKEEEKNFARFFFLNFKVSAEIVRRFFDRLFPPTNLAQTINNHVPAIINLCNRKRINAVQLDILRSVPGTIWPHNLHPMPLGTKPTSSKDFDLTMMICLLRNIGGLSTPSNGWDKLPHLNDTLPGANLATLKWYRNQLAHTTVTVMDNKEFTDKWTLVEKTLTSLNNGQRPYEVTEILNYDLDGEHAKTLANAELMQLKNEYMECEKEKEQIESDFFYYRDGNIPKKITEANEALVETWLNDDDLFYETKGSELVYDKVMNCSCILVTSKSGLGKTATIRHTAFKLKQQGFEIVPIESPEDIIKYKTNKKQVFLIDDVLGKYDLNMTLLERWERIDEKLISCLNPELGTSKILCTLRLQVSLLKRFKNASTTLNKVVINLEHETIALSKEEKQKILMKHLSRRNLENEITTKEVAIMCETNYAFPLLCKLVANDDKRFQNRIALFRQPLSLLKEELDKISNENKKLYCMLVLCMLFNGNFSRSIFDINSNEYDEKIYRIMQSCRLQRNISKKELDDCALSAIGSYFTEARNKFWFIHDVLEETISYHFYMFDPKVMFSECNILFIRDRVIVLSNQNTDENINENIVNILEKELNDDRFRPLYSRLKTELLDGRFSNLLMSNLFKNRHFVQIFGSTFDENIYTLMTKSSSEQIFSNQSVLKHTLNILSNDKFKKKGGKVMEHTFNILSRYQFKEKVGAFVHVMRHQLGVGSTLIEWIVAFGCYEFFRYAWGKMSSVEQKKISKPLVEDGFFNLAVLGGSLDIVSELICHGADINCYCCFWKRPLSIAVWTGRYDMVRLLLKSGAEVSLIEFFPDVTMNTPIAVTSDTQQFTSLIIACIEDDLNQTDLHEAVRHNDLERLRSNIRPENIDSKTRRGLTVLHYAVLLNNFEAVKVLFYEELPETDDSDLNSSRDNLLKGLCKRSIPNINIGDNSGITAVHLAVIKNNIEMLSLLLRNKADVMVRDDSHRTPLHYTTSDSATKLLLTHCSQKHCFGTLRNAYEKREYEQTSLSAFKTTCFNVTQRTAFRFVFRDFVNMQDKDGNTPLHSVILRHYINQGNSDLIETLIEEGANPYLFNYQYLSAIDMIKYVHTFDDTNELYINNSAKHRQLIHNIPKVFASVTLLLAIFFLLFSFSMISDESKNEFHCVGEGVESSDITLVQVTRSLYVLVTIVLYLSLSFITFDMWNSVVQWQSYLILVFITSVFVTLLGVFFNIQFIKKFKNAFNMIVFIVVYRLVLELVRLAAYQIRTIYKNHRKRLLIDIIYICFVTLITVIVYLLRDHKYFYNFSTMRAIYTLNITASNCTEFSSINISCTSLDYNITYRNGVDFSVQCLNDPNITSYNGTLIVESDFIDWSEIGMISMFWSHAICAYCFIQSILLIVKIVDFDITLIVFLFYLLACTSMYKKRGF